MTKKTDKVRQRLLASARRALAATNAVSSVQRYGAKTARIDAASKRIRRAENQPTPEQEAKAQFTETDTHDYVGNTRVRIGRAFKRQARFESIEGLTLAQLLALRRYRRAFDTSELSPVKSGLDIGAGGGSGGVEAAISRIEKIAFADLGLRRIEAGVPVALLPALRAVALQDQDFSAAAETLYGTGSSRRRDRVRRAFLDAAAALVVPTAPAPYASASAPAVTRADATPALPAAFFDDRGFMLPMAEIADVLRGVEEQD